MTVVMLFVSVYCADFMYWYVKFVGVCIDIIDLGKLEMCFHGQ